MRRTRWVRRVYDTKKTAEPRARNIGSAVFYCVKDVSGKLQIEHVTHLLDYRILLFHFFKQLLTREYRTYILGFGQFELDVYVAVVQSLGKCGAYSSAYLVHLVEQVLVVDSQLDVWNLSDARCHVAHS